MNKIDEHLVQPKLKPIPKNIQKMDVDLVIDSWDYGKTEVQKPGVLLENWQLDAYKRIKQYNTSRDGIRSVNLVDEEFGTRLLDSLLSTQDARIAFRNLLLRPDDKILLDVTTSDPDLLNYPWEACAHANWDQLNLPAPANLVAVARTTGPYQDKWPADEPLRILIAGVSAYGMSTPNFDKEYGEIEKSLIAAGLEKNVRFETYPLRETTDQKLQQDVYGYKPHVVHLVTHGSNGQHYVESSDGKPIEISSSLLADALSVGSESLCLFVSTACMAMQENPDANTWGLGRRLSNIVPITIGMQIVISEEAALEFTRGFYNALGTPLPILDAFVRARERIKAVRPGSPEWIAPVLYRGTPKNNLLFSRQNVPILLKVLIQRLNTKIDGLRSTLYGHTLWNDVNEILYDIDVKLIDAYKNGDIHINDRQKSLLEETSRTVRVVRGVYTTTKSFLQLYEKASNEIELAKLNLQFDVGTKVSDNLENVILIRDTLSKWLDQYAVTHR